MSIQQIIKNVMMQGYMAGGKTEWTAKELFEEVIKYISTTNQKQVSQNIQDMVRRERGITRISKAEIGSPARWASDDVLELVTQASQNNHPSGKAIEPVEPVEIPAQNRKPRHDSDEHRIRSIVEEAIEARMVEMGKHLNLILLDHFREIRSEMAKPVAFDWQKLTVYLAEANRQAFKAAKAEAEVQTVTSVTDLISNSNKETFAILDRIAEVVGGEINTFNQKYEKTLRVMEEVMQKGVDQDTSRQIGFENGFAKGFSKGNDYAAEKIAENHAKLIKSFQGGEEELIKKIFPNTDLHA